MVEIRHGSFVVSLDFELLWGLIDCNSNSYKQNVLGVYEVLPKMLNLFRVYNVHVTVATVGFIYYKDKKVLLSHLPELKPTYNHSHSSPYENQFIDNIKDEDAHLFFAPDLIELLKKSDNIEIGTHTFCHYYCWETGQTIAQFEADIKAAIDTAKQKGVEIKSIVFPRNNVNMEYLTICQKHGITSYRGNPSNFFEETNYTFSRIKNRVMRLLDTYINIGYSSLTAYKDIIRIEPVNIPASRFLRPHNPKLSFLDWLKLNRIKREMTRAAKENKIYHLWWHPHNFGINIEKNLWMLEVILMHYQKLHEEYALHSYSMSELSEILINK